MGSGQRVVSCCYLGRHDNGGELTRFPLVAKARSATAVPGCGAAGCPRAAVNGVPARYKHRNAAIQQRYGQASATYVISTASPDNGAVAASKATVCVAAS